MLMALPPYSSFVKNKCLAHIFAYGGRGDVTLEIRKFVTYDEETLIEGFRMAARPWRMFAVAAVVKNPWSGRYVEDLGPEIRAMAPPLGEELTRRIIALAGSGDAIEAYGKAAVVGLDGEVEHASALIHTLRFGNHYRFPHQ